MATATQVINKAKTYLGMDGSTFNTAYYGTNTNEPWCVVFIWYVFKQLGISNIFCGGAKTAWVGFVYDYYTKNNRFSQTPQPGDFVLYNWASSPNSVYDHIGIVISSDANYIYTIEGNTSNGIVALRTRSRNSEIIGYCHPAYDGSSSTTDPSQPTLSQGSNGTAVKTMQQKLMMLGFDCGTSGADGDFGSGTLAAVKKFQSANGLSVDGICGANTHAKLNAKYNALGVFTATCNLEGLKVRTGDSTDYAIFSSYPSLKKGETVKVARVTTNNWYFALLGNRYVGYVAAKYMKKN